MMTAVLDPCCYVHRRSVFADDADVIGFSRVLDDWTSMAC